MTQAEWGKALRKAREEAQLTQQAVGLDIKTSGSQISAFERNAQKPSKEVAQRLSDYFGLPMPPEISTRTVRNPRPRRAANHIKLSTLGENVTRLRKARGWTVQDLAGKAELHTSTISSACTARTVPSLETRRKLAKALKVAPNDLLRRWDGKPEPELVDEARARIMDGEPPVIAPKVAVPEPCNDCRHRDGHNCGWHLLERPVPLALLDVSQCKRHEPPEPATEPEPPVIKAKLDPATKRPAWTEPEAAQLDLRPAEPPEPARVIYVEAPRPAPELLVMQTSTDGRQERTLARVPLPSPIGVIKALADAYPRARLELPK